MNSLLKIGAQGVGRRSSITKISTFSWSIICLLFVVGCGADGANLEIISPEADSVHSQMPAVEIAWSGEQEEGEIVEFTAFLNGTNVTPFFTVDNEEQIATAGENELKDFLVTNGSNYLWASVGRGGVDPELVGVDDESLSEGVYFSHETAAVAPQNEGEIHVTEVVETGNTVEVSGYLSGTGSVASVSYWVAAGFVNLLEDYEGSFTNGEAELNEQQFTATLPVLDEPSMTIEFEVVYNDGSVTSQRFYRGDSKVLPRAIEVRENGSMINLAGNILKERFTGLLSAVRPLKIYDVGILEITVANVLLNVDDSTVEVAPSSYEGSDIDTTITVKDLDIVLDICIDFLGYRCHEYHITSDSFEMLVPTDVIVRSDNRLSFGPIEFLVYDDDAFTIDLPILRRFIGADRIASTVVTQYMSGIITVFFDSAVSKVIDDVMGGLVRQRTTTSFSPEGSMRELCTSGSFDDYLRDEQDLILGINRDVAPRSADVATPLGFRVGEFSPALDRTAPNGEQFDVVISYSTNVFNQVLLGGYLAGMYHLNVDRFIVVNGKTFAYRLAPVAPPFTVVNEDDDGGLGFHAWDMDLELLALVDEFSAVPEFQTIAVGKIRIDGRIRFRLEDDTRFGSFLSDNLTSSISELEYSQGFEGFNDETITRIGFLVSGPLSTAVYDSLSELGQPTLNGVTVPVGELWLDPQNAAYMIGINVPDVCNPEQSECPLLSTRPIGACVTFF